MKNFYEVGKVYVWQNQSGPFAYLNGKETTVIGHAFKLQNPILSSGGPHQETDTPPPSWLPHATTNCCAGPGDLRPKNPPPGEQSVLDMFKQPDVVGA
ncbi:hypothetical protein [Bradyrhizobium sp. BWC-3-1]|uniref:hypothetical protein n=1 Tax=Bradyrhizobium sp. BWC-3-1 TaxID=3080012 RepID=UPI00293E62C8|nr:hypothetical protein [Bradyrhizobium sp. BWC-3-1]WOH61932.1 hypothetical protein RX329_18295 [Bradyrhizobium sp. BWC-3-1]